MVEKIAILIIGAGITIAVWVITNLFLNRKRHETPCPALNLLEREYKRPCSEIKETNGLANHAYNKAKDLEGKMTEVFKKTNKLEVEQGKGQERDVAIKSTLDSLNENFKTLAQSVNDLKNYLIEAK